MQVQSAQLIALKPGRKETILSLTGVRALAAAWVVAGHFRDTWLHLCPRLGFLDPLLQAGSLGVDLFFGLSGFILAHNYLEQFAGVSPRPYGRFLGMRLARLYPVHLFTLLILAFGVFLGRMAHFQFNDPERLQFPEFVQNLLLVHSWRWTISPSWNGPAWSISAEWFAYLLFPFLSLAVVRVKSNRVAMVGVAIPLAVLLVSTIGGTSPPLIRIACEFTAGVFLYRLHQRKWASHVNWSHVALGLMAAVVVLIYAIYYLQDVQRHHPVAPLMVLFVFALARARNGIGRLLALPLVVFMGEASYSMYMTHDVVRMILKKLIPADLFVDRHWAMRLSIMAMYIAAICLAAVATYLIVEVRGRQYVRHIFDRMIPHEPKAVRPDSPVPLIATNVKR